MPGAELLSRANWAYLDWHPAAVIWALGQTLHTPTEKAVLVALMSFYDFDKWHAKPSVGSVAVRACCSRATAQRALQELVDRKVLTRKQELVRPPNNHEGNRPGTWVHKVPDFKKWFQANYRESCSELDRDDL